MKNKTLKIFIIAGEVSGDVLGAKIMRAIQNESNQKNIIFSGVGGENMQNTGLKSIFPISDLAVMGFFEVLAKARTLTRRINDAAKAIIKFQPDIVLTIDSPSFAKRVIKKVKNNPHFQNIKLPLFYHVVAPQVWAWGESRAEKYANIFDKLYCFFDFEKPYFEKYGLKTVAVGHPIFESLPESARNMEPGTSKQFTFLPGSRIGEIRRLLPIFKNVIEKLSTDNNSKFYIPVVETTKTYIENEIKNWKIKPVLVAASKRYNLFAKTTVAIAASGTVSAELAIMHIPAVIVYKMNPITTWLAKRVIKIKWVSLVNILLNKTVYPELLGPNCTTEKIINEIQKLQKTSEQNKMISELSLADKMWHKNEKSAAKLIVSDILNT